jgi:proteasome lid subunit RPN8/RPN11
LKPAASWAGVKIGVEVFHPMTNTDNSADHFLMDPGEQFKVVKVLRAAGQRMLAVHHSHPASPCATLR